VLVLVLDGALEGLAGAVEVAADGALGAPEDDSGLGVVELLDVDEGDGVGLLAEPAAGTGVRERSSTTARDWLRALARRSAARRRKWEVERLRATRRIHRSGRGWSRTWDQRA
jgi:hypothetical protein